MFHHLSLAVRDIERAAASYDAILKPLGYVRVWSDIRPGGANQAVGFGLPGRGDDLALKQRDDARAPGDGQHVAFAAPSSRRFPPAMQDAALRKLRLLNAALRLQNLRVPPGNRLDALKGDRHGCYGIRINDQWRICFRWDADQGGPGDVEIADCH